MKAVSPNHTPRPWQPSQSLEAVLGRQAIRVPANDYTLRLDNAFYPLLPPPGPVYAAARSLSNPGTPER